MDRKCDIAIQTPLVPFHIGHSTYFTLKFPQTFSFWSEWPRNEFDGYYSMAVPSCFWSERTLSFGQLGHRMTPEWEMPEGIAFQRIWLEVLCTAAHSWLEEFLKQFYCCVCSGISILHYEGKLVTSTIRPLVKKSQYSMGTNHILCESVGVSDLSQHQSVSREAI